MIEKAAPRGSVVGIRRRPRPLLPAPHRGTPGAGPPNKGETMRTRTVVCALAVGTLGATLVTAAAAIGTPTAEVDEVWVDGTIHRLVASGPAAVGKPTTTLY